MDKKDTLIHIDELFRNLKDGTEKESSGAWLNMKQKLDDVIPVGTPAISSGSRIHNYIFTLLTILVIGGGFTYIKWQDNKDKANTSVLLYEESGKDNSINKSIQDRNSIMNNTEQDIHALSGSKYANLFNHFPILADRSGYTYKRSFQDLLLNTQHEKYVNPEQKNEKTDLDVISGMYKNSDNEKNLSVDKSINKTTSISSSDNHLSTQLESQNKNKSILKEEHLKNKALNTNQRENERISSLTKSEISQEEGMVENQVTNSKTINNSQVVREKQVSLNDPELPETLYQKNIFQTEDGKWYKEERDSMHRIELVKKTEVNRFKPVVVSTDTIRRGKIERIQYVPLTPFELFAINKLNPSLFANHSNIWLTKPNLKSASTSENTYTELVPLSKYKVKTKKVNNEVLNSMLENTYNGIAGIFDGTKRYYASLIVGGNYAFSNPAAYGMHIGAAALYSLAERWVLSAEIKYSGNFFNNFSIQDESFSYDLHQEMLGNGMYRYSGEENRVTNRYSIRKYSSLQTPLTIQYSLGRISLVTGFNFAYAFPMSVHKKTIHQVNNVNQESAASSSPFENKNFAYSQHKDFGSRLGLGYILGFNYDFSRKLSLETRLSHTFYDNSKYKIPVINNIYSAPVLQVSLGYYFGRKERIVYMMDRK